MYCRYFIVAVATLIYALEHSNGQNKRENRANRQSKRNENNAMKDKYKIAPRCDGANVGFYTVVILFFMVAKYEY